MQVFVIAICDLSYNDGGRGASLTPSLQIEFLPLIRKYKVKNDDWFFARLLFFVIVVLIEL